MISEEEKKALLGEKLPGAPMTTMMKEEKLLLETSEEVAVVDTEQAGEVTVEAAVAPGKEEHLPWEAPEEGDIACGTGKIS